MKIRNIFFVVLITSFWHNGLAQNLEPFDITPEWLAKIEALAPAETTVKTTEKRNILVFSKATGFDHWTIPHNNEMLKILANKSGAFTMHIGYDIQNFEKAYLKKFDAVVFNNCNPSGPDRDLFADLLYQNTTMDDDAVAKKASEYQQNFMDYIEEGGGLLILHGAITVQNNSEEFSRLTGGSFDYHPKQQEMHIKEVDMKHPLVQAFNGKGLTHIDEPYFFKNAYFDYNFRPLLYMDVSKLEGLKKEVAEEKVYVSWIKRHGEGRVFYTSPSHNAQSLEKPGVLRYLLDGLQYVVGDLEVDDSPIKPKK